MLKPQFSTCCIALVILGLVMTAFAKTPTLFATTYCNSSRGEISALGLRFLQTLCLSRGWLLTWGFEIPFCCLPVIWKEMSDPREKLSCLTLSKPAPVHYRCAEHIQLGRWDLVVFEVHLAQDAGERLPWRAVTGPRHGVAASLVWSYSITIRWFWWLYNW